jgi:hypothetical protein
MKSLDRHSCSSLLFMEVMVLTLADTSYNLTHCHVVYEVFLFSLQSRRYWKDVLFEDLESTVH